MTDQEIRERARKIVKYVEQAATTEIDLLYAWISDELRAVAEEAVAQDRNIRTANDLYKLSRESGFRAGLEAAAKICSADTAGRVCKNDAHDDRWCPTCEAMYDEAEWAAQTIRALKPPEEK